MVIKPKFTDSDGGHENYHTLIGGHRIEKVGNHCPIASPGNAGQCFSQGDILDRRETKQVKPIGFEALRGGAYNNRKHLKLWESGLFSG